ncbi:hypothetical protein [Hydrogenimonas sp. SS33]|uniref:hypothetical protein n=1 Tax=Hydrogenimonas leucolamina TaxID=2954236 RepID=UPI00336C2051
MKSKPHTIALALSVGLGASLFATDAKILQAPIQQKELRLATKPIKPVNIKPRPITIKPILKTNLHIVLPPKKGAEKKPAGPDPARMLSLTDVIDDIEQIRYLDSVVGWDSRRIIQDAEAPNHFYYLPSELRLLLTSQGYDLNFQYNATTSDDKNSVLMTARMAPPERYGDTALLKAILEEVMQSALATKELPPAAKPHIHAIGAINAELDLTTIEGGLKIPKERIGIQLPATLWDPMTITMRLAPDEAEALLALLSGAGISGDLKVEVSGKELNIPFIMRYTRFTGEPLPEIEAWARGESVKSVTNITPFPISLESLNAYIETSKGPEPIIKKLKKSSPLKPGESRKLRLPSARHVFKKDPLVVWFGMTVHTDCEPCLETIDEKVRSGIALNPLETLSFEAIPNVFEKFHIYKIRIKVKTPYFTQKADKIATKEIELTPEKNSDNSLHIYMPQKRGSTEPLLFKYKIILIHEDGSVKEGVWHNKRETALYIGAKQLGTIVERKEKE